MKKLAWFERQFTFGLPEGMFPFYIERLAGTSIRLVEKVDGYSDELLSTKLDGKWSVKENIAHLAEVGRISDRRIEEMKSGTPVLSPAVFELTRDYNALPIGEVLEYFRTCRYKSLHHYRDLSETELKKSSLHPRLKVPLTAVDLAWFDAEHDDHHSVRINEILFTLKGGL
jgi:DinB superfamily